MLPGVGEVARTARGKCDAAFEDGAHDGIARFASGAFAIKDGVAAVVPVGAVIGDARNDRKDVRNFERRGDAMIGVKAEGCVARPCARVFAEGVVGRGVTVDGRLAMKVAHACGGFVVERKGPNGRRRDVEEPFGETRGAAVEIVERTRDAYARAPRVFDVLPGKFVRVVTDELVANAEEGTAKEVRTKIGVAVDCARKTDGIALGHFPAVLEFDAVTIVGDFAAPVAPIVI